MYFLWDISLSLTTGLVGLLTTLVIYFIYNIRYNHHWRKAGVEYEPPFPFLGIFWGLMKGGSVRTIDTELYKKHSRVFGAYEGRRPTLYVSDPEYLKLILIKDFYNFTNRREIKTGDPILDSFITVLKDDEWKRVRSAMSPSFSTGKIKAMIPNIGDCAKLTTSHFLKGADQLEAVECKRLFGNFTLDVIATVAFGTQLDSHNDPDNVFVTRARKIFNQDISLRTIFILMLPKLAKKLGLGGFIDSDFFIDLTNNIIDRRTKTKEVRHDFLQMMMESLKKEDQENGNKAEPEIQNAPRTTKPEESEIEEHKDNREEMNGEAASQKTKYVTRNEIVAQSVLFFLAGYDTTATTLTMVCYNLALNQEVQKKLQQEIDDLWKKTSNIDGDVLHDIRYLDAVINESIRLFPPAVRHERHVTEDYTLGATGIVIPKDSLIVVPIYAMHKDPEFFSQPEEFIPERFLSENLDSINPMTYLPFGAGPRNCVAMRFALMEIKINLIYLLKEVHFDVCPETKIPPDFYNGSALLQPKSVQLKVTRRNKIS